MALTTGQLERQIDHTHTHMHTHTHTHTHLSLIHTHTCTHAWLHARTRTHNWRGVQGNRGRVFEDCLHKCIHACTCIHTCMHTHARTHTHAHAHTHTHTQRRRVGTRKQREAEFLRTVYATPAVFVKVVGDSEMSHLGNKSEVCPHQH